MQAAGCSHELERAAAVAGTAAGFGLDEEDFVFYSAEDEAAAFLDAPSTAAQEDASGGAFGSSHFGLPDPATILATKTITLDGRSWGCGLDDDIALEETTQWLERDPLDDDDCGNELEPEDLEKFLKSALSPEPDDDQELDKTKAVTDEDAKVGGLSSPTTETKKNHQHLHGQTQSQSRAATGAVNPRKGKAGDSHQRLSSDASALQTLQTIVSKLDKRTRCCLRDAFYRLGNNAARRSGVHADATDLQRLSSRTASSSRRPEASTNSIDRSVASLLFRKEFPPPPLPLPPPSPPLSPRPPSKSTAAAAAASCSTNAKQQQHHDGNRTFFGSSNSSSKMSLAPVHKHRCAGSSSVLRTATTLRATPAAIPAAAKNNRNLLIIPATATVVKRRIPMTTSGAYKRGKHIHP